MKKNILPTIALLLMLFLNQACITPKNTNENSLSNPKKTTKQTMEPIKIIPFKTEYTAKVGQQLAYSCDDHASVGITSDYSVEDSKILLFIKKDTAYDNQDGDRPPGGDAAVSSFVFEAAAKGTTILTIREYFRAELKHEYKFTITVE